MIPEIVLNQIQDRLDIVEIISGYVGLKQAGRNFKACCPFHNEKTPSFIVNPDKQIFHCFGCGAGGNVFTFLMKFERRNFREVVESLAERAGVEVPKDRAVDAAVEQRITELTRANQLAMDFFHKTLLSGGSEKARDYLRKRGLGDPVIAEFKIGFAPESWDAFYKTIGGKVSDAVLERAGLAIARKDGGHYDRFRNRVVFPILDTKGVCAAFGARVLDDSLPKYLNSPESEIYSKGKILYGFYQARKAIGDSDAVILVEGYMDLVACHQAGVRNVVATCGTALTPDQVRLIKRSTKNVFVLFDSDKAGELATLKGLELFLEEDLEVKIVRLPEGHDPDSFIRERGAEAFRHALQGSKTLFDYKLAVLRQKFGADTLENKVKIANEMVRLFTKARNEILKAAWLKELAAELDLSEEAIAAEMRKRKDPGVYHLGSSKTPSPSVLLPVERLLIGLMLDDERFIARSKEEIAVDDFQNGTARKIVGRIFEFGARNGPPSAAQLINFYEDDPESARIVALAASEADTLVEKEKAFADCLLWIKRARIKTEREVLRTQIAAAQQEGDRGSISKLLTHLHELNKGIHQVHEKK